MRDPPRVWHSFSYLPGGQACAPKPIMWFHRAKRMRYAAPSPEKCGHIYRMSTMDEPGTKPGLLPKLSLNLTMSLYSGYYLYNSLGWEGGTLGGMSGRHYP